MSGNKLGFNPYEMLPPERTGAWGGWIASPIELLKLMVGNRIEESLSIVFKTHLDGFKRRVDILNEDSLREWITPTLASNETYGRCSMSMIFNNFCLFVLCVKAWDGR